MADESTRATDAETETQEHDTHTRTPKGRAEVIASTADHVSKAKGLAHPANADRASRVRHSTLVLEAHVALI